MVNYKREGLGLLLKLGRGLLKSEDTTEEPEEIEEGPITAPLIDPAAEPMKAYWETDQRDLGKRNQPFIDLFLKGEALERIPDATEEPVKESHYNFEKITLVHLPDALQNLKIKGNVLQFYLILC